MRALPHEQICKCDAFKCQIKNKEVPASVEKWNRNEIVGGLLGRAAVTNCSAAQPTCQCAVEPKKKL